MKTRTSGTIAELFRTFLYALLIVLVVRAFIYEPFSIPSASMYPTLLEGDYIFVSKFSYGYSHHSLPFSLPLIRGRIWFSEPERGDVVVFKLPTDNKTDYIKRLVGLPGDRIQVLNGILHVNGDAVERVQVKDFVTENRFGKRVRRPQFRETLPNGVAYDILELSDTMPMDNTGVYTVPEGHYFAMGDNRDQSSDSRFIRRVGFIPRENLVGRADFIFCSVNGDIWKFWQWPSSLRFSRFFSSID